MNQDAAPPRTLIARHQAGEISADALARALLAYPDWHIAAASHDGQPVIAVSQDDQGRRYAEIFSSEEALTPRRSPGEDALRAAGLDLFSALLSGEGEALAWIDVDPGQPHPLRYRAEHFPALRALCEAVNAEGLLSAIAAGKDLPIPLHEALAQLRAHDSFYLLLSGADDEDAEVLLAPDSRGRALAAVFTAPDAIAHYLSAYQAGEPAPPPPRRLRLSGAELAETLRGTQLEGLVINPLGPSRPVALGLAFLERLAGVA
jgi:hypothetical protein